MPLPETDEWCFEELHKSDPERALKLVSTKNGDSLIEAVSLALEASFKEETARIGVDRKENQHSQRLIVQFPVSQEVYDWFYSSRNGYRAHYWSSPEEGEEFNKKLVNALRIKALKYLQSVRARNVYVTMSETGVRIGEFTEGVVNIDTVMIQKSLSAAYCKVWVCEWLMSLEDGPSERQLIQNSPTIKIKGWSEGGLLVLSPKSHWLDLKGCFIYEEQPKDPRVRSCTLHNTGLT